MTDTSVLPPLIFFDIDQTLAESKQPVTPEMAEALTKLLTRTNVGIISGDTKEVVLTNVADRLPQDADRTHLFLLPTSGAALYVWKDNAWQQVYEEYLSDDANEHIHAAICDAIEETGCVDMDAPAFGDHIEHRGAQISISALGQKAPIALKKAWDPSGEKRDVLRSAIAEKLPEYDVKRGGMTTIDITKKGVNKAYGVRRLAEYLNLPIKDLLYVGDALYEGGNDSVVHTTLIPTHAVGGPNETLEYILHFLKK